MREKPWLLIVVGRGALITTVGLFMPPGLVLLAFKIVPTRGEERILGATLFVSFGIAVGIAAWWMFRSLQTYCTRPEARTAAIAFAVFNPISMAVALPLAQIPGAYVEGFLGGSFALVGALLGVVVMTTLLSYVLIVFTLRFRAHIEKTEKAE